MVAGDLSRVMEIARDLAEAPHWPEGVWLDALKEGDAPKRMALVAEEAGVVKGFAVASLAAGEAELESIAVEAAEQRHGVGRGLFGALLTEIEAAGVTEVRLEVRASNGKALDFYRALGFRAVGRRTRYYVDPVEDAESMSLRLGEKTEWDRVRGSTGGGCVR